MQQTKYFLSQIPTSIGSTVPRNAPSVSGTHETSSSWPMISITTPSSISSKNFYETNLTDRLLKLQNDGDTEEWPNFLLYCVLGFRKSTGI